MQDGDDSAVNGVRVSGVVTGRLGVGRFLLEFGVPVGTRATLVPGEAAASAYGR